MKKNPGRKDRRKAMQNKTRCRRVNKSKKYGNPKGGTAAHNVNYRIWPVCMECGKKEPMLVNRTCSECAEEIKKAQ